MAIEIKCPYNDDIVLQSLAQSDSTFNIVTPYPFEKIEDHSYAVSERYTTMIEYETVNIYDENGNYIYSEYKLDDNGNKIWTGRLLLSAEGYDFHFPHKQGESQQNNSIGWFNSWGISPGSINYTLGNNWTFKVIDDNNISGRTGLNDENEIAMNNIDNCFYVRNNNAIFDYIIQGPNHDYLKLLRKRDAINEFGEKISTNDDGYWFCPAGYEDYSNSAVYTNDIEKSLKEAQMNPYPAVSGTKIYYSPSQIEAAFGFDMNEPKTMLDKQGRPKYAWRIYGVYWYNGKRYYMECNKQLQENFNAMMSSQQLKANYNSFRLLITYVTQLASDIIYDNIEYANIVLVELDDKGNEKGDKNRWLIGDTIKLKYISAGFSNGEFKTGDIIEISTPNAQSKPEFLINDTLLVDFPFYNTFGDTLRDIYKTNFSYNNSRNTTEFDIIVDGLAANDLEIVNDSKNNWRLLNKKTVYVVPPIFDIYSSYNDCYGRYKVDVTNSGRDFYPVSKNIPETMSPGMYLSPYAKYGENTFSGVLGTLTLGSRYPMTPNAAIRFITKTVFHVEVDGDSVEQNFTIKSPSMEQSKEVFVRYNGLLAKTSVEKLDNTVVRSMNGVILQPYMYDATKIKVNYKLTVGKEIEINNDEVTLTISDNTGAGKGLIDIKLSDIVNRKYNDLIYSTGLAKNEAEGCYEITIFMAAKCSNSPFEGLGFNDSTVLVRFNINEKYKQLYNLRDVDYNVVYITTLPPYVIQGIPFTEQPENEKVLNSGLAPENSAARVDYNYKSYVDNAYGYTSDILFSNSNPLYKCVASAFVPTNFNGTISGVYCGMYDDWTGGRWPVKWTSADMGSNEYLVLTSGNGGGYGASDNSQSAKANIKLWTFIQDLDVSSVRLNKGIVSNRLEISAHLDYTTIDDNLAVQNMVTIRSNN